MPDSFLIVGAGIVGLSTAYWLNKRGCSVTVVERGPVPCPLASSADHHRLIRYVYGDADGYCARMREGFDAWYELWADLRGTPDYYYARTGMLAICREQGDYTDRSRIAMESLGVSFEKIDGGAAIATRLPFLEPDDFSYALLSEGGALMANRILADLADWLREDGVSIYEHSPVSKIDTVAGSVTLEDGRVLAADRLVVSAGVETSQLLPDLSVDRQPVRSVIVYADPPDDLRTAWKEAPCWTDLGGDTDLWGMSPVNGLPLKLGNGHMGSSDPDDSNRTVSEVEFKTMLSSYTGLFRGAERFNVRWGQANYWTMTPGSRFVLEEHDRAVVVTACAGHGFKFGALSGRDVSQALCDDDSVDTVAKRMATLL